MCRLAGCSASKLDADQPSFHTYDYARHFLSACTRILGLETMPNGIEFEGRYAQVGTFPIGIDPTQFTDMIREPKVVSRVGALKDRFKGCKVSLPLIFVPYPGTGEHDVPHMEGAPSIS